MTNSLLNQPATLFRMRNDLHIFYMQCFMSFAEFLSTPPMIPQCQLHFMKAHIATKCRGLSWWFMNCQRHLKEWLIFAETLWSGFVKRADFEALLSGCFCWPPPSLWLDLYVHSLSNSITSSGLLSFHNNVVKFHILQLLYLLLCKQCLMLHSLFCSLYNAFDYKGLKPLLYDKNTDFPWK